MICMRGDGEVYVERFSQATRVVVEKRTAAACRVHKGYADGGRFRS
jgi:hypothetical protein